MYPYLKNKITDLLNNLTLDNITESEMTSNINFNNDITDLFITSEQLNQKGGKPPKKIPSKQKYYFDFTTSEKINNITTSSKISDKNNTKKSIYLNDKINNITSSSKISDNLNDKINNLNTLNKSYYKGPINTDTIFNK
jgi:galactitol-specific phosphotransferase system IIB component